MNDLSSFLKVEKGLEVERMAAGRLFHAGGPATADARSSVDARRVCAWYHAVLSGPLLK